MSGSLTTNPATLKTPKTPKSPKTPRPRGEMPRVQEIWTTFGDAHSESILAAANSHGEYKNAVGQFYARLFLIVCGLSADKTNVMFAATLPTYLTSATSTERNKASRIFEDGQASIEDQVSMRIRAYSQMWLESPGGIEYETRYGKAK